MDLGPCHQSDAMMSFIGTTLQYQYVLNRMAMTSPKRCGPDLLGLKSYYVICSYGVHVGSLRYRTFQTF